MKDLKKVDRRKAMKYANINRYIDDLIAINDSKEFEMSFLQIYPSELTLNRENDSDTHATFLDMDIKIENNQLITKMYDKRESYDFEIVRLPFKNSNMPSKMFYNTIGAEILRICRVTTNYKDFVSTSKPLLKRMRKQGANDIHIKQVLIKSMTRHQESFNKYVVPMTDVIKDVMLVEDL